MKPDRPLPLSPAQRRLWVMAQLRPDDPFYNIPFVLDLAGPLDAAALRRALSEIVRRHPQLRTVIRSEGGAGGAGDGLVQVAAPPAQVELPVVTLTGMPEPARRADELAAELADAPFDLARGPLFRALLMVLGERTHRLVVNVHHIVFDGASFEIFIDELVALYGAFADGGDRIADLPEPADFGEVLGRQLAVLDSGGADAALRYWTDRLRGAPEVMELPIKGARPAVTDHQGRTRSRLIPRATVEPLRAAARRSRSSMFMLLKTACDVLLRQHGGTDVIMGVPISGRDDPAATGLIGLLTKPCVLRREFRGDPAFGELLKQVRGDVLDAHDTADMPFEAVVRQLGLAHDPSYYPLYQVMFGYHAEPSARRAGELRISPSYLRPTTTKVELEITLTETGAGLRAELSYRADLFDEVTIDQMLARLETLLERIGRDPDAPVSQLVLPSEAEWRQVVEEWNRTSAALPHEACIHHLVEAQAGRTPDAVAAEEGTRRWTYRELDEAAGQVGHYLRELGVGPEERVGVCMPRTLELLATMLGIFKAGGVYVPLDPAQPAQRLAAMVEDAGITVALADPRYTASLDEAPTRVVPLGTGPDWIAGDRPTGPVPSPVVPANAAYILFTSGSTGGPKGVVLEHRNLINLLAWARREHGPERFAAVPLISSLSFDVSMWEVFTALSCGGRVIMADDPFALAGLPGAAAATILTAVPSILAELLKAGGLPPSADLVIANGEVLPPSVLRDLYDTGTVKLVHNMYAPTETTTFSLFNAVRPGEPIPIGRPMDNTTAYVLDPLLRPVPPGVVGQLHLGGAGITRGYLNRPGLTAERFIPDPFSAEPGRRLYATGDMVRHGPDGRILFVGRVDHQVKLRGCRIELGEVEATMLGHPAVGEACALVRRGGRGDALVAAMTAREGAAVTPAEVRAFLQERLPGYMVPDHIEVADALPLLPSGKLDRKRILRSLAPAAPVAIEDDPPASDIEREVAAAWAGVLGHRPGVTQNFFDAGGNSLLLVLLRERLRAAFRRDIEAVDLFLHPTVRAMADFLSGASADAARDGARRADARRDARQALAARRRGHHASR